ncbi:hypothetical protein [Microcoleus sp. FACHB-68]|uniref:hypothetical protein n=1 Tax=Microcoleus sp. FACHB-68 TaxID=2692826 RepID=UPI001682D267|nr:hypothetical protein [Microcoleus sp. FACHB-68]MBD1936565.1 hypothetical protein [Microcoleus sp. FACHB-68]
MTSNSFVKKLPWVSILLLVITYFNFGWLLLSLAVHWWVWLLVIVFSLSIAEALAAPFSFIRNVSRRLLGSDTTAFLSAIVSSFLGVVILAYFDVSAHALLLVAVAAFARLDLQARAVGEAKSFFILSGISLTSLGLGAAVYWGVNHISLIVNFFD